MSYRKNQMSTKVDNTYWYTISIIHLSTEKNSVFSKSLVYFVSELVQKYIETGGDGHLK